MKYPIKQRLTLCLFSLKNIVHSCFTHKIQSGVLEMSSFVTFDEEEVLHLTDTGKS